MNLSNAELKKIRDNINDYFDWNSHEAMRVVQNMIIRP